MPSTATRDELEADIRDLEQRLERVKRLLAEHGDNGLNVHPPDDTAPRNDLSIPRYIPHSLFLLSDTALPLGSFAYSSGLESFIAHNKPLPPHTTPTSSFYRFLALSISSLASTNLPYLLKAYRSPDQLETLDNDLDASTPCSVARRASVAQGLALLGVWERAFKASYKSSHVAKEREEAQDGIFHTQAAVDALDSFSESLKRDPEEEDEDLLNGMANGHLAPLWGVVCVAMGVDIRQAAYIFMLNHAKAVLSAAVRASVMGPYHAQAVLASRPLQEMIVKRLEKEWATEPEDAGQIVPVIDFWVGRHELLYSRIFNS